MERVVVVMRRWRCERRNGDLNGCGVEWQRKKAQPAEHEVSIYIALGFLRSLKAGESLHWL